jgi:hypothetical protein
MNDSKVIDPAIWDVAMLNRILTECRVYATHSPEGPWLDYPPEQDRLIMVIAIHIKRAIEAKCRRGIEEGMI